MTTTNIPIQITYELICDDCGAEYDLYFVEDNSESPMYCPFCGCDVNLEDVEDDEESLEVEELDFDDDDERW
jgi:rRNA maturation endonuclease Nob1